MKNIKARQACCIAAAIVLLSGMLFGCTMSTNIGNKAEPAAATTTETTTVTTTVTTTEDLNTTFAETSTNKVYEGLKKDKGGSYKYKLAEYTTSFSTGDESRSSNIGTAADIINNLVVKKGQVFSFNQTVGKRTVTSGFGEAHVISNGELVDGLGGGICQVSSTLFEAVLRANLEIVQRTNHSLKVGYVPLGGDATVDWNSKDFKFKNNLKSDIKISMICSGGRLTCTIYSKKQVDIGNVNIHITKSGKTYTLTRTVDGKTNYTTKSKYNDSKH